MSRAPKGQYGWRQKSREGAESRRGRFWEANKALGQGRKVSGWDAEWIAQSRRPARGSLQKSRCDGPLRMHLRCWGSRLVYHDLLYAPVPPAPVKCVSEEGTDVAAGKGTTGAVKAPKISNTRGPSLLGLKE